MTRLPVEPNADDLRACVSAIREGGKFEMEAGPGNLWGHAVVRYANGLPPDGTEPGVRMWEAIRQACEGAGEPAPEPESKPQVTFESASNAIRFATETLSVMSLANPVEKLAGILTLVAVGDFDYGPDNPTGEQLDHARMQAAKVADLALRLFLGDANIDLAVLAINAVDRAGQKLGERLERIGEEASGPGAIWQLLPDEMRLIADALEASYDFAMNRNPAYEILIEQMRAVADQAPGDDA